MRTPRHRRFTTTVGELALVAVLAVGVTACIGPGGPPTNCARPGLATTVAYKTVPGVTANLTSLDVHAPANACNAPVVMWIHGGGYRSGDKKNAMADKIRHFNSLGWMLVSANYRLTVATDPASARFPDHFEDVADAVAWVHGNIAGYGGNPQKIALLGHSAGADIVSNVVTNPTYLQRQGLPLTTIRCAGPLDTEGFDKAAAGVDDADGEQDQWQNALGNNPNYLTETSATKLVKSGIGVPRMIGVVRGTLRRQQIETAFLETVRASDTPATTIDARSLTHNEVNTKIGQPGDTVMTPPLTWFLATCFAS